MEQEDLRNLSPRHAPRDVLEECEHLVHVAQIVVGNPHGDGSIAATQSRGVCRRVHELVVVDSHRRHGVAVARQKGFERTPHLRIRTHMQERVTEVSKWPPLLLRQPARHHFAAEDVGLELIEGHRVQVAVRVRVVAQLESRVQPHCEQADAGLDIARPGRARG